MKDINGSIKSVWVPSTCSLLTKLEGYQWIYQKYFTAFPMFTAHKTWRISIKSVGIYGLVSNRPEIVPGVPQGSILGKIHPSFYDQPKAGHITDKKDKAKFDRRSPVYLDIPINMTLSLKTKYINAILWKSAIHMKLCVK